MQHHSQDNQNHHDLDHDQRCADVDASAAAVAAAVDVASVGGRGAVGGLRWVVGAEGYLVFCLWVWVGWWRLCWELGWMLVLVSGMEKKERKKEDGVQTLW